MGLVLGRKPGHETCVFPCKVAAGGDERRLEAVAGTLVLMFLVLLGVLHFGCPSCVCSSLRLWNPSSQIALEWLHECCMGLVLGRKPEHETFCFSVCSGCRRRWRVPCVCGGCGLARRSLQRKCWFDVFCEFLHLAVAWCFGSLGCKTHCNGRMKHGAFRFSVWSGCRRRCRVPCVCGRCGPGSA